VSRHVDFLARLLLVWSAFNAIIAVAVLAFAISAAALALNSGPERPGTEVAAGITAATMLAVSLSALTWAAVHYVVAKGLAGRRQAARVLGLVLGLFDLLLFPLGTGVGAYAIWVLLQEDTRTQFTSAAPVIRQS
jgi:hypothetical protein